MAKIYHNSPNLTKLQACTTIAPKINMEIKGIPLFACPSNLLYDNGNNIVGFTMKHINNSYTLKCFTNYQLRQQKNIFTTYLHQHKLAYNLAYMLLLVQQMGIVIGDMKTPNFMVDKNSMVIPSLIDFDSCQISLNGKVHNCPVTTDGYNPPEMVGKKPSQIIQPPSTDNFRLAIIFYEILFGNHPFLGKWIGSGSIPPTDELISKGYWPFSKSKSLIERAPYTHSLDLIHSSLQQLFLQCFNEGLYQPDKRPTPKDWIQALDQAIKSLKQCTKVPTHYYDSSHVGGCYWCERANIKGVDLYPDFNSIPQNQVGQTPNIGQNTKYQPPQHTQHIITQPQGGMTTIEKILLGLLAGTAGYITYKALND